MDYLTHIFSAIALIISVVAIWLGQRNRVNQKLLEEKLLQLAIDYGIKRKKADLRAKLVHAERSSSKLHIWNQGGSAAENVHFECMEKSMYMASEIEKKFPLDIESDSRDAPVTLIARIHLGTPPKHEILLKWTDEANKDNKKKIPITI